MAPIIPFPWYRSGLLERPAPADVSVGGIRRRSEGSIPDRPRSNKQTIHRSKQQQTQQKRQQQQQQQQQHKPQQQQHKPQQQQHKPQQQQHKPQQQQQHKPQFARRKRSFSWSKSNSVVPLADVTARKHLSSPPMRRSRSQPPKSLNAFEQILNKTHRTEREVKASLSRLRRLVLSEGLPEENSSKLDPSVDGFSRPTSLRSRMWKYFLGVYHVSAKEYVRYIKQGPSLAYNKLRNDTFRTLATDKKFLERVNEDTLIRVLNATVWKMQANGNQANTYVQGMNVLAAPFLYTMSELDAFYSFATFLETCCPLYVTPTLQGVHCGAKLLDECLKILDPELFAHLSSKGLAAEIYAFPSILTFSACTPPLDQVLKLWDFLFAYGVHLNVLCVAAQLIMIREKLLEASSPMKLLRSMPDLDAAAVIARTVALVPKVPSGLYDKLVRHPFDTSVAEAYLSDNDGADLGMASASTRPIAIVPKVPNNTSDKLSQRRYKDVPQ